MKFQLKFTNKFYTFCLSCELQSEDTSCTNSATVLPLVFFLALFFLRHSKSIEVELGSYRILQTDSPLVLRDVVNLGSPVVFLSDMFRKLQNYQRKTTFQLERPYGGCQEVVQQAHTHFSTQEVGVAN